MVPLADSLKSLYLSLLTFASETADLLDLFVQWFTPLKFEFVRGKGKS